MRLYRVGGAVGFVLVLGACEVHVGSAPPPPTPGPTPAATQAQVVVNPPPNVAVAPTPPPTVHPHFTMRTIHPAPLPNQNSGQLNVAAMKLKLKPGRKCGPRESTVGSNHWINLDCTKYKPLIHAIRPNGRKAHMLKIGKLRLDTPVQGSLPDAVDHRNDGTEGPIKDQGQVGSCTAFSLSSAIDNGIRRQNKPDTSSSLHVWSHYGQPDMNAAGDGNLYKDIATWQQWPYDERLACEIAQNGEANDCGPYNPPVGDPKSDKTLQADITKADGEGNWYIKEYDAITADADTVEAMLATGADVWFAMELGDTFFQPVGDTISDWTADQIAGGHAILFAGYRHKNGKRQFLVHNSWGSSWGDKGFAYINETMMAPDFLVGAWKVVVVQGKAPNPPPAPPNPPPPPPPNPPPPPPDPPPSPPTPPPPDPNALTDDDCGENELVDSVTGQCAEMCADDSRPANGQCPGSSSTAKPTTKPPPPPPPGPPRIRLHH
jgi:hypothetical protein